ncbi:hypothetical protein OV079_00035 [Nannocystis pusilla]|uniref:Uncharacterized protein n=1 Tax=Nannocystis pusilla TaxID=889268 RepID=A0A9X3EHU2_9BACT|nr:hypothetical protein [Nannocystis pusilla]MCY1003980.1 hypothetical protein [Nannocystis pusilla]
MTGTAPTDLDSAWFDAAQQETNNVIVLAGITLNSAAVNQLAQAVEKMVTQQQPRGAFSGNYTFRTQSQPEISATGETQYEWRKTTVLEGIASGANGLVGRFVMPAANVVWQAESKIHVIETTSNTNRGNCWRWAGGTYSAGAIGIDAQSDVKSSLPLAALTFTFSAINFKELGLTVAIPAAPAAKLYNIFAVTTFTFVRR